MDRSTGSLGEGKIGCWLRQGVLETVGEAEGPPTQNVVVGPVDMQIVFDQPGVSKNNMNIGGGQNVKHGSLTMIASDEQTHRGSDVGDPGKLLTCLHPLGVSAERWWRDEGQRPQKW